MLSLGCCHFPRALQFSEGFPHRSICHSSSANPSKFNVLLYSDHDNYFLWNCNELSLRTLPKRSSSGQNKLCPSTCYIPFAVTFLYSFWHAVTPKQIFASPKVTGINCETDLHELDPSPMTSEHPTLLWCLEINLFKNKIQAPSAKRELPSSVTEGVQFFYLRGSISSENNMCEPHSVEPHSDHLN